MLYMRSMELPGVGEFLDQLTTDFTQTLQRELGYVPHRGSSLRNVAKRYFGGWDTESRTDGYDVTRFPFLFGMVEIERPWLDPVNNSYSGHRVRITGIKIPNLENYVMKYLGWMHKRERLEDLKNLAQNARIHGKEISDRVQQLFQG